jgi:hypothetical protein
MSMRGRTLTVGTVMILAAVAAPLPAAERSVLGEYFTQGG